MLVYLNLYAPYQLIITPTTITPIAIVGASGSALPPYEKINAIKPNKAIILPTIFKSRLNAYEPKPINSHFT